MRMMTMGIAIVRDILFAIITTNKLMSVSMVTLAIVHMAGRHGDTELSKTRVSMAMRRRGSSML